MGINLNYGNFNWIKDKLIMNVERVVSIILGSEDDSDWNMSEEGDQCDEEESSMWVDQLSVEQHVKNGGQIILV